MYGHNDVGATATRTS